MNKIPGAESACGMMAGKSRKSKKCSSLWNISLYVSYIKYQLSQEITSRLLKYLIMVTLCIDYLDISPMKPLQLIINLASELGKRGYGCPDCGRISCVGRRADKCPSGI
jgi:hypothetical protein